MDNRALADLVSIGPKMLVDLELLGIASVSELAHRDPDEMYVRMCRITSTRQDPCVLDTYRAAVAQARDPDLPAEQRQWWYWSRLRKAGKVAPVPAMDAPGPASTAASRKAVIDLARASHIEPI